MKNPTGTKQELIKEISALKRRIQELEQPESERKKMEEALHESEERFRRVTESLQEAVWYADLSGKFEFLSPIMAHIYGRPLSEMMGNPDFWVEVSHPEDQAAVHASKEVLLRDHRVELEYRIILPDGTVRWIADRKLLLLNEHGEPSRIAGILSDITDRKRADEALRGSEKQYRTLFEAIADTVFLIDQETGSILDVNPTATRMYGFSRDEFLRMTTTDVSAEPEKTARATSEPVPFIPLRYHRHKDGSVFPVELAASSFELLGRNTIIATARDITARKQADEKLQDSENRFRQLADSTWEGIIIHREGIILDINESILKMSGWHYEDAIGKSVLEFLAPESIELALQKLKENIGTPQIYFEGKGLK